MRTRLVLLIALLVGGLAIVVVWRATSDPAPRFVAALTVATPPGGAQLGTPLALSRRGGETRVLTDTGHSLVEHPLAGDGGWTVLPTAEPTDLAFGLPVATGGMLLWGAVSSTAPGTLAKPAISRDGGASWSVVARPTRDDGRFLDVRIDGSRWVMLTERIPDAFRVWLATSGDDGATWSDSPAGWRGDEPGYREAIHALAISPDDHQPLCAIAWSEQEVGSPTRWTVRLARGAGDPRTGRPVSTWPEREAIMAMRLEALAGGAWLLVQTPTRIVGVWVDNGGNAGAPLTIATRSETGFSSAVAGDRCLVAWLDDREAVATRFGPPGARFRSLHARPHWRELRGPRDPLGEVGCADGPALACSVPVITPEDGGFRLAWWVQAVGEEDPLRPAPGSSARVRVVEVR